jgi:hypothetical protein
LEVQRRTIEVEIDQIKEVEGEESEASSRSSAKKQLIQSRNLKELSTKFTSKHATKEHTKA